MFARKSILAATALVTLGLGSTAMAQFDDTPFNGIAPSNSNNQRGGGFKPLDMRPYPGAPVRNYNTNPLTAEGAKTARYQAEQRDLADANNRNNNTFPQYDTDRLDYVDRTAVTASDRVEPVIQPAQTWTTKEEPTAVRDGIDSRFLKPADPAVVSPDTKNNAGIDRTLAQDYNLARTGQSIKDYSAPDQVAFRDISNNPIDSMNDPSFRGPVVDMNAKNSWDNAQTASEVIRPEPVIEPTPVVTPEPMQEVTPTTDRNHQPAVWKGARALQSLDNTGNPLPEKTIFGRVGDVPSEPAPNHLPRP